MFYETKDHHGLAHNPLRSLTVPRPIGWVSTRDGDGVVNLATRELREAMNATSAQVARYVNEFELAGLTPTPSRLVNQPRVKESPVHLACTHLKTVELGLQSILAGTLATCSTGAVVGILTP